jgi:hypothetical protein
VALDVERVVDLAWTARNFCADPAVLKPCILRSHRRVGSNFLQELAHEFQRGTFVPFALDQHIEDFALGVNGASQIDNAAINFRMDLVKMPDRVGNNSRCKVHRRN